jgi:hypothetical protein
VYAAHFAAGLAIKSRVPETPTWALLIGAFLPDFFWIAFGLAGLEPSQGPAFFDDWSHSLAMVILWGVVFALLFWRRGFSVVSALWLAVFSHFLLDLPIHPKNIALYPHSSVHLGWNLWDFGAAPFWFATRYWWTQMAILVILTAIYAYGARKMRQPANLICATCLILLGLHLMTL